MKAKHLPWEHVTDELVTTDEWDARRYDIEHELAAFQDKEVFAACRDRNFATTFLDHAADLIEKRTDIRPVARLMIEQMVRELKREIRNYDAWRIFMLTLELATITYRSGSIPRMSEQGVNCGRDQSIRRDKRQTWKGLTRGELAARNEEIIDHFNRVKLTRRSFAAKHAADYGLSVRTVRAIIPK